MGEWLAHPGRVIIAGLAIAIGVALGFAVHLINASALNEFDRAVRTVNGDADLQVRAVTPLGFDEALYPKLVRLDGIEGQGERSVCERRRNAGGIRDAERRDTRARFDEERIDVAVIAAFEFHRQVSACEPTSNAQGRHRGFGAGVDEAHHLH